MTDKPSKSAILAQMTNEEVLAFAANFRQWMESVASQQPTLQSHWIAPDQQANEWRFHSQLRRLYKRTDT